MSTEDFAQIIRVVSLVGSAIVLLVLVGATIYRFRSMDPVERLFCFGLIAESLFLVGVTYNGLKLHATLFWYTPVLAIANIWLIGALIILTLRPVKVAPHLIPPPPLPHGPETDV